MLAFLGQDGAEEWDQRALVAGVGGENGLSFWECAENDIGEGLGEGDGLDEVGDGELVFTRLDGGLVGACEDAVHTCSMQLLLLWSRVSV